MLVSRDIQTDQRTLQFLDSNEPSLTQLWWRHQIAIISTTRVTLPWCTEYHLALCKVTTERANLYTKFRTVQWHYLFVAARTVPAIISDNPVRRCQQIRVVIPAPPTPDVTSTPQARCKTRPNPSIYDSKYVPPPLPLLAICPPVPGRYQLLHLRQSLLLQINIATAMTLCTNKRYFSPSQILQP